MRKLKKSVAMLLTVVLALALSSAATVKAFAAPASDKNIIVYYPNWACYSDVHQQQFVTDLPWSKITVINHAFWAIFPVTAEDGTVTYPIDTLDPWADFEMENNHFAAYEEMAKEYPDVNVMLSIGGWTRCGYFSEMAATPESRASFIQSCIEVLNTYTFLGGIDIDWEYPGIEREPEGTNDEGNPASPDDAANYTLLLSEMRKAFDEAGMNDMLLTVCAPANPAFVITEDGQVNQELAKISEYVDFVNLMTYDLTGSFNPNTGHQSNLYDNPDGLTKYSTDASARFYLEQGVPSEKLNIGSPLYSRGWGKVVADSADSALGAEGFVTNELFGIWDGATAAGQNPWFKLRQWEISDGFELGYDEVSEAAYMYNTNPDSKYYQLFFTYENERSLQAKLDYINENNLAGLIVWESSGDSIEAGYPMITQMAVELGISDEPIPAYTPTEQDIGEKSDIQFPETVLEWYVEMPAIVKGQIVYYNGGLYMCLAEETYAYSESWNPTEWEAPNYEKIGDLRKWEVGMDHINFEEYVAYDGAIYQCTNADGTDAWSEGWNPTEWEAPNYQKISAIEFVSSDGEKAPDTMAAPVGYWTDSVVWNPDDIAIYNGNIYTNIATTHVNGGEHPETTWGFWSETIGAEADILDIVTSFPDWDDERIWPQGAIVSYEGGLHKCLVNTHIGGGEHPLTTWGYWEPFVAGEVSTEETAPSEPVVEETVPVEPVVEETAPVEPVAVEEPTPSLLITTDGLQFINLPLPTGDETDLLYTVQSGEKLWSIAFNYYGSMGRSITNRIYQANYTYLSKTNGVLEPGTEIILPGKGLIMPVTQSKLDNTAGLYQVKAGDTLSSIAAKYYGSPNELPRLLKANADTIGVVDGLSIINEGQWLVLDGTAGLYLVKAGDTLSSIAAKYYGSTKEWSRLLEANAERVKVVGGSPIIYEGQWLVIPGK